MWHISITEFPMNRLMAAGRDTCAGRRRWPAAVAAGLTAALTTPIPGLLPNRQRRAARTHADEAAIRGRIAPYAPGLRRPVASARNPPESRREPPAGDGKDCVSNTAAAGCRGRRGPLRLLPAPLTVAGAPCHAPGYRAPRAGAEPFGRVHDRHAAGRALGDRPVPPPCNRRFGRRVQPGDRRHPAGQGGLFQPEPRHLPGQGLRARRRGGAGQARPVARRERDEFPGQCRPLSVRQPDPVDSRRKTRCRSRRRSSRPPACPGA